MNKSLRRGILIIDNRISILHTGITKLRDCLNKKHTDNIIDYLKLILSILKKKENQR